MRAPPGTRVGLLGTQYTLMDLRSRENSSVNSFLHMSWIMWLQTVPISRLLRPDLSVL